jgi:hypothetical protein
MSDLRKLVWAYLVLLIFEGALRKWVVHSLDAPLLLVRDPLVMWIYYQSWRQRLWVSNTFISANLGLAIATAITATVFGIANPLVTIYGLRTDYLQIPLIFLLPQILDRNDVVAMGRFLFVLSLPMAALVILQFRSPHDSLINVGTMATHYDTVRPSGTFSFVTGVNYFYAITTAFFLYGYLQGRDFKLWQMIPVLIAIMISAVVSGSRTGIVSIGLVVAGAIFTVIVRGKGGMGIVIAAVLIGLAIPVLSSTSVFKEGTEQLGDRFSDAGAVENKSGGLTGRFAGSLIGPILQAGDVPFFGWGLGLGTNAAAGLFQASASIKGLYWPEQEWDRLIFECGPIFGIMLCIFRATLFFTIGKAALDACRRDNTLPLLLFSSSGLLLLNGQWGVPTTLGFAIFFGGLTLAACNVPEEWDHDEHEHDEETDDADHAHETGVTGEAP